ncbi:MAG: SurA N-terminal domain-containing protein [Candidatus Deferrimicrobiaceae bacterium]|jgi:peptidyl-prolyl cis-trans isomerase D
MLDVLRRNAGSWVIKGILTFIALTFIWWGVGSYSESSRDVAATVGEETISMTEFAEAYAGMEKTYREVYGKAFTPEMAKALNLRRQAMESLIRQKLMLAEAETMGIATSKEEVQKEIAATPAFQVDGKFREDRYQSILTFNRVLPSEYEAARREEITIRKVEGLFSASARVPESEAHDLYNLTFRKIKLLVVASDPAGVKKIPSPTEGELAAKYEQTRESYRIPARVKLSVAPFSPETFAARIKPSEQEILSFYEGNADRFQTEESRLVHPVTVSYAAGAKEAARKKTEEALAEGRKGKTRFEEIAKKLSRGKEGATWVTRSEMRPDLADAVFSAAVDDVVGPVDTGREFTIVRVNRIKFSEILPLEQVRERVLALLKLERGKDIAVIRAYEAHGKAMESQDLAGACAPFGVTPRETGWSDDGKENDVPPAVVQEALLLQPGDIGPVRAVGDTHYLFRVTAKENSRIPPLSDVRNRVEADVEQEKRIASARAEIGKALTDAKTSSDLKRNATRAGLAVTTTPFFPPLSESLPGILAEAGDIRRDLLDLSPKSPVSSKVFTAGTRFLSVAFVAEQPADQKEWETGKDAFLQGLVERKRVGALEAFLTERMKQAKVQINPEALK